MQTRQSSLQASGYIRTQHEDQRASWRPDGPSSQNMSDNATIRAVAAKLSTLLDRLACPNCHRPLELKEARLECSGCSSEFEIDGVGADLRPLDREEIQGDETAWRTHWSAGNQKRFSQRLFSVYRRVVTARTVKHFANRYFPASGVFVEAGSGTSETSRWIDKHGGGRKLVAVDLLFPVLARCHPVMDVRLGGDIFRLPFADGSVDGIWNVGVMEHFTHTQIDRILREFRRVLAPGGRVIMLWPGKDAVPQNLLRLTEALINIDKRGGRFLFHPAEISKLDSIRHGQEVLARNGFATVALDAGAYSLMAFKVVVGEKTDRSVPPQAA